MQQGGFPGAGGPHNGQEFTGVNIQVHVLQYISFYKLIGVILEDIAQSDHLLLRIKIQL
jgi:hypothetical protein